MNTLEKEKLVRDEITRQYDQLVVNCRNVAGAAFDKHGGDLLAVCMEFFLSKDLDYQVKVVQDGKLEHYITKMMRMQLHLGTTRFYHHYRKFNEKQRELLIDYKYSSVDYQEERPFADEEDPAVTCLKEFIKTLDPYKKMIVDKLITGDETVTSVSRTYNIPYGGLKKDLLSLKRKMKNLCQQHL